MDSLAAGLKVARSTRIRAWVITLVLPALASAAGYWYRSIEIKGELAAIRLEQVNLVTGLAAMRTEMRTSLEVRREVIAVGRQAAYATAGFEAYEVPKRRQQKRDWAAKYAAAYDRMVRSEGTSPEVAYTALFRDVSVP